MIDVIGTNAGLIWHALNESNKPLTVKELQKSTGIRTQDDVRFALGWLAKEGKITFDTTDKDVKVSLVR
ncbi:MAG: winged helix-turn-helix domain-containing protein [Bacteroidales bacterium]|uniref:winged helix-turn-helix domain-containing protein n=1 Tax=Porphyromonas sp. TaxID=1924944 RepID=UPI0029758A16|nr:winged helix-turn-helix domain-containing protein [Porphyromonas sp.]MDD7438402.1 winged helix-turn-helix domain-containing protein [Bacteroidales bacterium]MDY3066899.1 winged helix-turn-helix domain-containing protein [Porphyromonas sp.]